MTSGNRSDEPIAYDDHDAIERLAGIADLFLTHDRPIHLRCDDSVTRVVAGVELPLRRSRGYAPQPIRLPVACRRPILALGGQLKVTFALGRGRHAFLSHHLGDLDHYGRTAPTSRRSRTTSGSSRFEPELHRARPAPGLRVDPLRASEHARLRHPTAAPSSTTTPTWPVAWPRTVWTSR